MVFVMLWWYRKACEIRFLQGVFYLLKMLVASQGCPPKKGETWVCLKTLEPFQKSKHQQKGLFWGSKCSTKSPDELPKTKKHPKNLRLSLSFSKVLWKFSHHGSYALYLNSFLWRTPGRGFRRWFHLASDALRLKRTMEVGPLGSFIKDMCPYTPSKNISLYQWVIKAS